MQVKLQYEIDLGAHVVPVLEVSTLPVAREVFEVAGIFLEVTGVIATARDEIPVVHVRPVRLAC